MHMVDLSAQQGRRQNESLGVELMNGADSADGGGQLLYLPAGAKPSEYALEFNMVPDLGVIISILHKTHEQDELHVGVNSVSSV